MGTVLFVSFETKRTVPICPKTSINVRWVLDGFST